MAISEKQCARCGELNAADANFCSSCGGNEFRDVFPAFEKQCTQCGEINPSAVDFCASCGAAKFRDVPPGLAQRLDAAGTVHADPAVYLGMSRVIALTLLSSGLYVIWWLYITWKHPASETNDDHYPVWHTLAVLVVPVYSLFRVHKHMSIIKGLAEQAGLPYSLSPGILVVLFLISSTLGWLSLAFTDVGTLVTFAIISTVLTTVIVAWPQSVLNSYWDSKRGAALRSARIGVGEVTMVLIGLLAWVAVFLPLPE